MNDTESRRRRLKVQMKAILLARNYLQELGEDGAITWQELSSELQLLKEEYRYLTFEENHGSLAAEMVVGDSLEENTK